MHVYGYIGHRQTVRVLVQEKELLYVHKSGHIQQNNTVIGITLDIKLAVLLYNVTQQQLPLLLGFFRSICRTIS